MQRTENKLIFNFPTLLAIVGLFFIGTNSAIAQGKCPISMEKGAWKKCWIKEAKSGNKNLRGANLADADFQNADLSNADLTNAKTQNANFSGADLSGANLTKANLGGANLKGANFRRANLTDASLSSADLTNADFTDALIFGTYFLGGAKIGGAKIDLTRLQCRVSTNGEALNTERTDGRVLAVFGSLKNDTLVYKNGNNMPFPLGRISVTEIRGDELVDVGLVDGKFLTCNTPTKVNSDSVMNLTSESVISCKLRFKGAALIARTPEGKAKFRILKNSGVYVFERKNRKAMVGMFNDDNEKLKGWIPDKYLVCDRD